MAFTLHRTRPVRHDPLMSPRRPPEPESTGRNEQSGEAAFQAAPAERVAEILEGELYLQPRPARPHANVYYNLASMLGGPFKFGRDGPGGWVLLAEPELHLGLRPDKVVSDLAGWRRERLPHAVGGAAAPAHDALAPDWACEILSPSTRRVDEGAKLRIYAREGVRHLWHVDPLARTLELFRLEEGQYRRGECFTGEGRVRVEPFAAIELDLALVWSE